MPRNSENHPEPNDPNEGVSPKFPPGTGPLKPASPPRPGVITKDDVAPVPARDPFPDHTLDPGVTKR